MDATQASILLVDDHPENLTALEAILSPLGENLLCAHSGEEALRLVLKHDVAAILMDVQMPRLDGFETAALIRAREKSAHIPIIFITAFSKDREAIFQGYAIGAVDYIAKPFNADILLSKVRVFVELHRKREQVKLQAQQIYEAELREAERRQQERERELEREHLKHVQYELEMRVQERTAQLQAANAELEAFCYSVSHDLRAPLRAVMSTSQILLQDAGEKLAPEEVSQLQRQAAAAKRLGSLIDDLLQLSRLGRKQMELVDLNITKMAADIAGEIAAKYPDRELTFSVDGPAIVAHADQGLVQILLQNLLDNAYKYSPNGGSVTFGAGLVDDKQEFFVRDTGIGFDMAYAHKLFMPFERLETDPKYQGTGIGLAIVERIIRRHGGRVWGESEPGKGATFRFTLS